MSGAGKCIRIVANTIDLSGRSSIALDCEKQLGGKNIMAGEPAPVLIE